MKQFFFSVLTVLALAPAAHATSIRDVRLLYKEVPTGHGIPLRDLTSVVVYGDGEVVRITCDAHTPRDCARRTIRRYNAYQIDAIDHLVEAARHGRIGRSPTTARCIVAPSSESHISADNGSVFLYKGHICTSITENKSVAAKRLVQLVDQLRGIRN